MQKINLRQAAFCSFESTTDCSAHAVQQFSSPASWLTCACAVRPVQCDQLSCMSESVLASRATRHPGRRCIKRSANLAHLRMYACMSTRMYACISVVSSRRLTIQEQPGNKIPGNNMVQCTACERRAVQQTQTARRVQLMGYGAYPRHVAAPCCWKGR